MPPLLQPVAQRARESVPVTLVFADPRAQEGGQFQAGSWHDQRVLPLLVGARANGYGFGFPFTIPTSRGQDKTHPWEGRLHSDGESPKVSLSEVQKTRDRIVGLRSCSMAAATLEHTDVVRK